MKRQSVGIRRSSEESHQSQVTETKRLKVFHEAEHYSNADMEAGSGSDTTEECISVDTNGKGDNLETTTVDAQDIFPNKHSENSSHNHTNGTYSNIDNNSADPFVSNMNGSHAEPYVPKDIFTFTDEEDDDDENQNENNSSSRFQTSVKFGYSTTENADNMQNILVAEAGEPFQDERSTTPPMPSLIPSQDLPTFSADSNNPNIPVDVQSCSDVEGLQGSEAGSSASAREQLSAPSQTEVVPIPMNCPVEPSCSSQDENEEQIDVESLSLSKGKVDVENITLCELRVTQLEGHADVVFSVAADEDFILSSSGDTTVKVWDVEKRAEVSNFAGHNAAVTSVILLNTEQSEILRTKLNCFQTSRIAVSASYDCHIRLWSVLDGHEILSVYTFNSITCMGYLENHMYVVVGTEGGKLEVWDLHLAKLVHFVYAHDSSVTNLKVHDCYIYSTSKDGAVKVWLFDEGELQPLYTRRRKETTAVAAHFGPTQWQAVDVHNDVLYLGDNTCRMKALDWRLGRLRLFVNQPDDRGICEAILAKNNILLTTFFNSVSDTGGINVWRLPELTYVGTLTGDLQEICSLALVQSQEKLRIISGGHQLIVWDFDFSKPPIKTAQDPFFVCEVDKVGLPVNEESVETAAKKRLSASSENIENKKSWCNIS